MPAQSQRQALPAFGFHVSFWHVTAYAGLAAGILASDWTRAKVDMKHTGSMPSANEEEEAKGEDSSDGERG